MASLGNRIVVLIDMDCFYCQVEAKLNPELAGKPLAVVQYNQWRSGGIIAVNYEARDFGVTRHMRGDEAKEKCPELLLARVPCVRGKADTSRYRSAGRDVINVLKKHCNIVERASVDEAYIDITQIVDDKLSKEMIDTTEISQQLKNTYIVGHSECGVNYEEQRSNGLQTWLSEAVDDNQIQRLAIAGVFVERLRKDVFEITGYKCSAGISFNKILAKLACGLHKPNRQTILPESSVLELFGTLPVKKVKNLGGKFGDIVIDSLKCNVMADLLQYSLQYLQNRFEDKTGLWLYNIARGIDIEPVTPRLVSKSIGACKRFPGKQAIIDAETLKHWLGELSEEVCERLEQDLEENERKASLITISFQFYQNKSPVSQSRSIALTSYKPEKMTEQSFTVVTKATQQLPIAFLGISAGKFIKAKGSESFMNFFKASAINEKLSSIPSVKNEKATENHIIYSDEGIEESTNELNSNPISEEKIENEFVQKPEEHKKIKSPFDKVKRNRRSSPCSKLQSSLETDNFKQSFFMNILKSKEVKKEPDLVPLENQDSLNTNEYDVQMQEDSINDNLNECDYKIEETNTPATIQQTESSSSTNNEATIALQEIFPDLNDIDPEVVKMLPLNLQQEAKEYMKAKEVHVENPESSKVKSKEISRGKKGRPSKSKPVAQQLKPKNIQNFFIKTDANDDSDNNYKKCMQCDQMILINKFEEHSDYHVAQNLQKEMNRIPVNDDNKKRKVLLDSPKHIKKRLSNEFVHEVLETSS